MATGNSQYLAPIIDDTKSSTRTTYSSDKLDNLMKQFGASDIVYLLTVSETAPSITTVGDKYYKESTGLIYEATSMTAWDNGNNPEPFTLYVDLSHKRIYVYDKGNFKAVSGSVTVSEESYNAIKDKADGLYVKDLSQEVKNINIAQKTVNSTGIDELLNTPVSFTTSLSGASGKTAVTAVNKVITLDKSIKDYTYIDIYMNVTSGSSGTRTNAIPARLIVDDIVYNPTTTERLDLSIFNLIMELNGANNSTYGGEVSMVVKCWFQDDTHIFLGNAANGIGSSWSNFTIEHVQGISKEIVTIDPVNYIDTTQGIQDTPVGSIIENLIAPSVLTHYLKCDGSIYNIVDYPELAQVIKESAGAVNFYGGDGITTFGVPTISIDSKTEWWSPMATSNDAPYPVTASAVYQGQLWYAFNESTSEKTSVSSQGYFWHSANSTASWIAIDLLTETSINGIRILPRYGYPNQCPATFKIQGSNDGVNWTTIESYSGLPIPPAGKYREHIFDNIVSYRYYKIADMTSNYSPNGYSSISDIQFLKVVGIDKGIYIKAKPTYFIGSVNGIEERKELSSAPVLVAFINGVVTPSLEIPLSDSLENYDYIEVQSEIPYGNAGMKFGKHVTRIPVSDIVYEPNKSEWNNTYQEYVIDWLQSFTIWYGFKDNRTCYIGRVTSTVAAATNAYRGYQITKIVGIRNIFALDKVIAGGSGCSCESPTDADITAAITSSVTELDS